MQTYRIPMVPGPVKLPQAFLVMESVTWRYPWERM
jgi:hypothetical protein